jgi:malonate transporter
MNIVTLLLPDFLLILIGFVLIRVTQWGDTFWAGLEKLVYYLLFPALLFTATARTKLDFGSTGLLLQVALGVTACGILLAWLARPFLKAPPMFFESGVQTAFRFNSYIALAAATRIGGEAGTSMMALIMGFAIPIVNMAAVHALVRKGGGLGRELLKNPLILATGCGLLWNISGVPLPDMIAVTLGRMGAASVGLGLLMVGAGLRLSGLADAKLLAGWFIAVKLLALPLLALVIGRWVGLAPMQLQIVVAFAALPTASSAYVLAARLGGNPPFVAFIVSAGTLLSALSLPFWLSMAN